MIFLWLLLFIFIIFILINLLIFLHELGHFLVAKSSGVTIPLFVVGFGPKILKLKFGDTKFYLKLFPLGGYVLALDDSILQEIEKIKKEVEQFPEKEEALAKKVKPLDLKTDYSKAKTINKLKISKKILFALMGIIFNFFFLFFALFIQYETIGRSVKTDQIGIVTKNLKGNIEFIEFANFQYIPKNSDVNDNPVIVNSYSEKNALLYAPDSYIEPIIIGDNFDDLGRNYELIDASSESDFYYPISSEMLRTNQENNLFPSISTETQLIYFPEGTNAYVMENGNSWSLDSQFLILDENNHLIFKPVEGTPALKYKNFTRLVILQKNGFFLNFGYAIEDTFIYLFKALLLLLNFLTLGLAFNQPNLTNYLLASHWITYYYLIIQCFVIFSAITILFNLIPMPPLDGWKVVEYGYEGIKKKPINEKTLEKAYKIGWSVIIALFILSFLLIFI